MALVFATGTKLLTGRKICCPFMLSPGPTPLIFDFCQRATNVQVVRAETIAEGGAGRGNAPHHSLFDFVVDDVRAGTVRAYTGLDIVLSGLVHPESPKLIKMKLSQLDIDGILDASTGGVEVPLYLNLTRTQFEDVLYQLGLANREKDVALVRMNVQGVAGFRIDPTEQFINQLIGRMGRHKTNTQSTWDSQENFFQSINFKIRIGPQKKNRIDALEHISRGQKETLRCSDSPSDGCDVVSCKDVGTLCDQNDQFVEFGERTAKDSKTATKLVKDERVVEFTEPHLESLVKEGKIKNDEKEYLMERKAAQDQQDKEYDDFLDREPREDGTSHAASMEHVMRLTTHRVRSNAQNLVVFAQIDVFLCLKGHVTPAPCRIGIGIGLDRISHRYEGSSRKRHELRQQERTCPFDDIDGGGISRGRVNAEIVPGSPCGGGTDKRQGLCRRPSPQGP